MSATNHYSKEQVLERWRECIWADHVPHAFMHSQVLPALQLRHLQAGQSIWRTGDAAQHWTGVLGGAAKLCVHLEDGRAVTLCSVAGSWIGEAELLRGVPYACDAVALHDLTVVQLPSLVFDALTVQAPGFQAFRLSGFFAAVAGRAQPAAHDLDQCAAAQRNGRAGGSLPRGADHAAEFPLGAWPLAQCAAKRTGRLLQCLALAPE